jgi:hypothetical protein
MSDFRGVTEVNGIKEYRCFVGGKWSAADDHKLFDMYRPYDRGRYARVAAGGPGLKRSSRLTRSRRHSLRGRNRL